MAYELKDMNFSFFKNNKKEKDTHPDFTGEIKINGEIFWISAWQKQDKNGSPYFSGAIKKKDFSSAKPKPAQNTMRDDMEDEIPF